MAIHPMASEPKSHSVTKTNTGIVISWKCPPFCLVSSILWRGIYLPVIINSFRIKYGETNMVTISYKDKIYSSSMTKWKYLGGTNGVKFPKIETARHELKLRVFLHSLQLTEMPKDQGAGESQQEDPFSLFYFS
jgi:hypothetical protein